MMADAQTSMNEFLNEHNLVLRICDGAITFCDGNCERCAEDEEHEID